jgi:hypothetical protein
MELVFGLFAIGFGVYTLVLRLNGNEQMFSKLQAMKKLYGNLGGAVVHVTAYTVLPLAAGAVFVLSALLKR